MNTTQEFDYIIVGGGSAGCALAGRLSEDPNVSVCVMEAGGSDDSVFVKAPLGVVAMVPWGLMFSWHYFTTPQTGFKGRKGFQPRGKVLGGSSSINAMVYTRCNRNDYDGWAALGNPGWSYADLLPLFKRAENSHCFHDNPYHGNAGPLHVSYLRSPSPANEAFRAACVEKGIPFNPDYNGETQYGISPTQATQFNGERWNAARAYLHANADRKNLHVWTQCQTRKVLLDGKVATGVEVRRAGATLQVKAKREVILSAGAFGSPQLLMLSGIGPKAHLQQHGIAVVHDLPGVGQNLQDHITTSLIYRTPRWKDTVGLSLRGSWEMLKAMIQWRRERKGWITSCVSESNGFVSTTGNTDHPDIQLAFLPSIVDNHTRNVHLGHGYTLHTTLMRPKSRGSVTLQSADPSQAPLIDPGFFTHPDDMATSIKGARIGFGILEAQALAAYRGKRLHDFDINDDAAMEAFLRKNCDTEYHPVGTCKMGPDSDPMAVVDAQLRVRGIDKLRVVDASIMPHLVSGNTNAPTMVIGEKAADLIRQAEA
jgi:choline dehydrogenase-like flavoprotein